MTAMEQAVDRLAAAALTGKPCRPVRDLITDVADAYEVQRRLNANRTAPVAGRKIGLTSPAVQRQLGVDQPDFGVLFADMEVKGTAPVQQLLQPKVEAEIAFVLAADLTGDLDLGTVRAAVEYAVPALEIVDSRIANWDITITDTVADNASSGLYALGADRLPLSAFEPVETTMRMYADGRIVSEGNGAACLGDPLNALLWLARTARDVGDPLRAGQVILSGALGPMVPVSPGLTVRAEISGLGTVAVTFDDEAS
ncbi:2-oxo-3-hexenedioate decarboxylase/2-keto-4-pentenoate hydratase [Nonomuraea polychroma]|uniref:2-oxo-3-hexenedioate decarboxylase/2-keto-4-pentenoate hydratase n=1 Tax=Nonomuraea polychroma TaxID=46176 RepID=A0A438LZ99_9ACTN|nr:fumarylacetoacetate hydrolase family protein [Nonomuraea polychroma]RVX38869.1 2-oxo-3-hexenedioate decarboxylase/2-keto-4-pentenoate hydratase [Nonomuraea polychroma]